MRQSKFLFLALAVAACTPEREPAPDVVTLPEKLIISPVQNAIVVGGTAQFSALFVNTKGDTTTAATSWKSLDAFATIDGSGKATGIAPGQARIVVTFKTLADTAYLNVSANTTTLAQIALTGPTAEVRVDSTFSISPVGTNAAGSPAAVTQLVYTIADPSIVAQIGTTNQFKILKGGNTTIRATSGTITSAPFELTSARHSTFRGVQGHTGQGMANVFVKQGLVHIRFLSSFNTPQGPDYRVFLSRRELGSEVIQNGVEIAILRNFNGEQTFIAPASVSLYDYPYLLIHCRQYNVSVLASTLR